MKLQAKIFALTTTAAILLGGPLVWTVRQAVHHIIQDEVGQRGLLAAQQLAEHATPLFRAGSESALLPMLQAAQDQTGALYVRALNPVGLVLAHTNVAEKGKMYTDGDTRTDMKVRQPRVHPGLYKGRPIMEVMSPVFLRSAPDLSEDFMLSGSKESAPKEYLGFVELGVPLEQALATEYRLFRRIVTIMLLGGGVGILLFFVFMRHMLRPVEWLSAGTARIARGDYGGAVPVASNDELGSLAHDFNQMSQVLAETTVSKQALQASQVELTEAQRLAHIGSYQSLSDRSKVTWSDEVYRIFGRDAKLPVPTGADQRDLFTPESWSKYLESRTEALKSGAGYAIDLEIIHPDGRTRWITLRGEPVVDSKGLAGAIRGTVQDVTEVKLAQNLLEQKEKYFRSLIENTSDVITVLDTNAVVQYESPSLVKILGYEAAEMVGTSAIGFIHPDDQAKVMKSIEKALQFPGVGQYSEYRFKHKDGSWRILEAFGTFIPGQGTERRIVVNSRDVTERKMSEQQRALLFTAIEQSKESILITDADGAIQYVNSSFEKESGYSRAEVVGQKPSILRSGKHEPEFYAEMWRTLKAGHIWDNAITNKRKDGSLAEVEESISPVMNEAGEITNFVAVMRDVTERRKMEVMVRQSDKMSAVGQLAAGVAHEINNPLGVILGFAQALVRRMQANDPLEMPLKSIEKEAIRCKNLVQDLLTFSRAAKADREPMDINRAVEGALSLVTAQARVGRIEVKKDLAPDLPRILGNPNQIQQIIINLSNNAMDAMMNSGVLTLKTEHLRDGPLSWVCLNIMDTGPGIPAEIRSRIFDPFFTTKPVGKGTGLGLSLVHEIVEKHAGTITVESRPGQTQFLIKFPVRSAGLGEAHS